MIKKELITYLVDLSKQREGQAMWSDIEKSAKERHIPIMDKNSMNFVKQLIRLYKPRRILEIGTAIGYSALQMYKAYPSVKITTIERDEVRFEEAQQRIINHQLDNRIQLILGDASDVLQNLREKELNFDFVLIDAAKGQYRKFFDLSTKLLEENGVIITDNVLFKGYVFEDSNVPKRFQKMVQKIQAFNEYIIMHEDFTTEIIPIGDGIAISVKKSSNCS